MKLHQAWAVARITPFARALSMTACTAASSDVAIDGEHATPTGEALQSRDKGAGPTQRVSQAGEAGKSKKSNGGGGTGRRRDHSNGTRPG